MPSHRFLAVLLVTASAPALSQTVSPDPAALLAKVDASYYHPDDLAVLDCAVNFDFESLFRQLGRQTNPEILKNIGGLKIRVHGVRDANPRVDIKWEQGTPATSQTIETDIRELLSGFLQMYWQYAGTTLAPRTDQLQAIARPEGGYVLNFTDSGATFTVEVDRDSLPVKFRIEIPGLNTEVNLQAHFSRSEHPAPDDLNRLRAFEMSQRTGSNTLNQSAKLDYQDADGFHLPRHVTFDLGGAHPVALDFTACSPTRQPAARTGPPKKP